MINDQVFLDAWEKIEGILNTAIAEASKERDVEKALELETCGTLVKAYLFMSLLKEENA